MLLLHSPERIIGLEWGVKLRGSWSEKGMRVICWWHLLKGCILWKTRVKCWINLLSLSMKGMINYAILMLLLCLLLLLNNFLLLFLINISWHAIALFKWCIFNIQIIISKSRCIPNKVLFLTLRQWSSKKILSYRVWNEILLIFLILLFSFNHETHFGTSNRIQIGINRSLIRQFHLIWRVPQLRKTFIIIKFCMKAFNFNLSPIWIAHIRHSSVSFNLIFKVLPLWYYIVR